MHDNALDQLARDVLQSDPQYDAQTLGPALRAVAQAVLQGGEACDVLCRVATQSGQQALARLQWLVGALLEHMPGSVRAQWGHWLRTTPLARWNHDQPLCFFACEHDLPWMHTDPWAQHLGFKRVPNRDTLVDKQRAA